MIKLYITFQNLWDVAISIVTGTFSALNEYIRGKKKG